MGMAGTGYNSAFLTSSQGMPVLPEYFKIKEFIMIRTFTTTFFFFNLLILEREEGEERDRRKEGGREGGKERKRERRKHQSVAPLICASIG